MSGEAFVGGMVVGAIVSAIVACCVTTCSVHHRAAEKGAGRYDVDPLTGDTTWVWRGHPSAPDSYAPVRYRPMTDAEKAAEAAQRAGLAEVP